MGGKEYGSEISTRKFSQIALTVYNIPYIPSQMILFE